MDCMPHLRQVLNAIIKYRQPVKNLDQSLPQFPQTQKSMDKWPSILQKCHVMDNYLLCILQVWLSYSAIIIQIWLSCSFILLWPSCWQCHDCKCYLYKYKEKLRILGSIRDHQKTVGKQGRLPILVDVSISLFPYIFFMIPNWTLNS